LDIKSSNKNLSSVCCSGFLVCQRTAAFKQRKLRFFLTDWKMPLQTDLEEFLRRRGERLLLGSQGMSFLVLDTKGKLHLVTGPILGSSWAGKKVEVKRYG